MVLPTMLADLGARALEQAHAVHRVQQLAVRGLKPSISGSARLTMTLMA
jgi:hypothetical protein